MIRILIWCVRFPLSLSVFCNLFLCPRSSFCLVHVLYDDCLTRTLQKNTKMLDFKGHMDALKRASDSFFLLLHIGRFTFTSRISTELCVMHGLFFFISFGVSKNVSVFWACFYSKHWILISRYLYNNDRQKKHTERNLKDLFGIISIALMRCLHSALQMDRKLHGLTANIMDITQ